MSNRKGYMAAVVMNTFPLDGMECALAIVWRYLLFRTILAFIASGAASFLSDYLSWSILFIAFVMSILFIITGVLIRNYQQYSAWEYYLPIFEDTKPVKRQSQEESSGLHTQPLCEVGEVVCLEGSEEGSGRLVQCGA